MVEEVFLDLRYPPVVAGARRDSLLPRNAISRSKARRNGLRIGHVIGGNRASANT